jgi:hypothetical protein
MSGIAVAELSIRSEPADQSNYWTPPSVFQTVTSSVSAARKSALFCAHIPAQEDVLLAIRASVVVETRMQSDKQRPGVHLERGGAGISVRLYAGVQPSFILRLISFSRCETIPSRTTWAKGQVNPRI